MLLQKVPTLCGIFRCRNSIRGIIPLRHLRLRINKKDWRSFVAAALSRTRPPHLFNCQNPPGESFNSFHDEAAIAVKQSGNPTPPDNKAVLMNISSHLKKFRFSEATRRLSAHLFSHTYAKCRRHTC